VSGFCCTPQSPNRLPVFPRGPACLLPLAADRPAAPGHSAPAPAHDPAAAPGTGTATDTVSTERLLYQSLSPFHRFLKIVHVNAQSVPCHIDELRVIFNNQPCDVILVSESWLKGHISSASVEIPGYKLYRNDRLFAGGGGTAAYVKSNINVVVLEASDTSRPGRPEWMFLDATVSNTHVLLGLCYKPPKIGFLAEFEDVLVRLMPRYSHVVVMGDFNTDLLGRDISNKKVVTSMFESCSLTILPLQATHHTDTSHTWLDLMAVSDPDRVAHHGQLSAPGISKHDVIFCVLRLVSPRNAPKFISYRDFKNIDFVKLTNDARDVDWLPVLQTDDVNTALQIFNQHIIDLFNQHAPVITKRVTRQPAPWISNEIRRLMADRDSAYRKFKSTNTEADRESYKNLRNRVKQCLRNAKTKYLNTYFTLNKSSRDRWRMVKSIGATKSSHPLPESINLDELNDDFVNIPVDVSGAASYARELAAQPVVQRDTDFYFTEVSSNDVLLAFRAVKSNAVGADEIPINFIRLILPVILPVITAIFNKSFSSSTFPSAWKDAIVKPLVKSSPPTSSSDYRPISILPALSKVLEKIVHKQVCNYLIENNLFCIFQSGFRTKHSTTTALLCVTEDIRLAMEKRLATLLTLFDFSKAFDCVYRPLLLEKLKKLGFSAGSVAWFGSYLSQRRQRVMVDNLSSEWRETTRGVPQGSVLGPLLFCLYINDFFTCLTHSKYHLYADDLQIYYHFHLEHLQEAVDLINQDVSAISLWAKKHGLKLNVAKTQTIIIGHYRLMSTIDLNSVPPIILDGTPLRYCEKIKNLGLMMNCTLNWSDHVVGTCNKVFSGIHSLKRFDNCFPFDVRVMLVKSLVFPHFDYCDIVINDMTVKLSEKLQRAQNYCLRYIFNIRRDEHITPFFRQLSLLKLAEKRKLKILSFLYNLLQTKTPSYLSSKFTFNSSISARDTRRGSTLLSIPLHRTTIFNKSFTVTASRLWNSLPSGIQNLDSSARFGAAIKDLFSVDSWGDR